MRGTLTRITASYNRSKGARRKMRARGLRGEPPDETVRLAGYDEIMDEVNDAQLELEAIIDEIKTSEKAYPSAKALLSDLDKMQDYLNAIVDEYEKAQRTPDAAAGNLRLDGLTEMSDFVAKASSEPTPRFKSVYGKAHKQVRTAIRNDLGKLAGIEPQAEPKK